MGTEVTLTEVEQLELANCEHTIKKGLQTFFEVGSALSVIEARELYRDSYVSFAAYCNARWSFSPGRARQLIEASVVQEQLQRHDVEVLPEYEKHARPLLRLAPEDRPAVWNAIVRLAPEKGLTHRHIEGCVKGFLEERERRLAEAQSPPEEPVELGEPAEEPPVFLEGQDEVIDADSTLPEEDLVACPNCGGSEFDEDGDCEKCREPGVVVVADKPKDGVPPGDEVPTTKVDLAWLKVKAMVGVFASLTDDAVVAARLDNLATQYRGG